MFAQSILHAGESKNQSERPKPQKHNERKRPIVCQEAFAPSLGLDVQPHSSPKAPGFFVEQARDAKSSSDAPRQNHGLKRIHQDEEDQNNTGDRCPPMHRG